MKGLEQMMRLAPSVRARRQVRVVTCALPQTHHHLSGHVMAIAVLITYSHFNQLTWLQICNLAKSGQTLATSYTVETVPTVDCLHNQEGLLHLLQLSKEAWAFYIQQKCQ